MEKPQPDVQSWLQSLSMEFFLVLALFGVCQDIVAAHTVWRINHPVAFKLTTEFFSSSEQLII